MSDITIGNPGRLRPGISREELLEFVVVSGRKVNHIENGKYGLQPEKKSTVEIYLYALDKERAKVDTSQITFKDVLDAISVIENLKILSNEIENQINIIKDVNPKVKNSLKFFSEDCIEDINDKIDRLTNQPTDHTNHISSSNNQNLNQRSLKIAAPLNNQPVIAEYAAKFIDRQKAYLVKNDYINENIKKLPIPPKTMRTRVNSEKFKLHRVSPRKTVPVKDSEGKNTGEKTIIATAKLGHATGRPPPAWFKTRLVSPVASLMAAPAIGNKITMAAGASTNRQTDKPNQPLAQTNSDPPQKQITHVAVASPSLTERDNPMVNAQQTVIPPYAPNNPPTKKIADIKKQTSKPNEEKHLTQQIVDALNDLEVLFEDKQVANEKHFLSYKELKDRLEELKRSVVRVIKQQRSRSDPCKAQEVLGEKLKMVINLKNRLTKDQSAVGVKEALAFLQASLYDLDNAYSTVAEACRRRRIALFQNFNNPP